MSDVGEVSGLVTTRDLDGSATSIWPSPTKLAKDGMALAALPVMVLAIALLTDQRVWWAVLPLALLFPLALWLRALAAAIQEKPLIIISPDGVMWRTWFSRKFREQPWTGVRMVCLVHSIREYGSSFYFRLELRQGVERDKTKWVGIPAEYLKLSPDQILPLFAQHVFTKQDQP